MARVLVANVGIVVIAPVDQRCRLLRIATATEGIVVVGRRTCVVVTVDTVVAVMVATMRMHLVVVPELLVLVGGTALMHRGTWTDAVVTGVVRHQAVGIRICFVAGVVSSPVVVVICVVA